MSKLHYDETFDRAMRDRYREAVQHVSSSTRSKLAANRHAATRRDSMPIRGWPLGATFGGLAAVVFAVTLGLNFSRGLDGGQGARPGARATDDAVATAPAEAPIVTALDEDPEFYAWLASADAQLMAME